jgi:FkbM family methyltransferase
MLSPFRNVSLFNAAVGCSNANVCMSIPSVNGIDNLYECNISENGDLKVVCLPIDCICSNQKVSLVKIDVEGHELQVLQGMKTLIEKFHPLFIIEGSSLQVEDFLKSYGYFYKSISIKGSPNRIFIAKQ